MLVAGVDGCPFGWLAVFRSTDGEPPCAQLFKSFADILKKEAAIIAVDIPIGLPTISERGGRKADRCARKMVGRRRQSSVFPTPSIATLRAKSFLQACQIEQKNSNPPKRVSQQVFNILYKIREVDAIARNIPDLIFECHPEVSFCAMNNNVAMSLPKKVSRRKDHSGLSETGLQERCRILIHNGYSETFATTRIGSAKEHGRDDLIDACAAAWTAERILKGNAIRFPTEPDVDACSLDMTIWA
jgi:predicted RNase H-like nuclease